MIFLSNTNDLQTDLFVPLMGPKEIQSYQVRVDLGVIAIKAYSTFPKALGLEPYHQKQFSFILRAHLHLYLSIWGEQYINYTILYGHILDRKSILIWKILSRTTSLKAQKALCVVIPDSLVSKKYFNNKCIVCINPDDDYIWYLCTRWAIISWSPGPRGSFPTPPGNTCLAVLRCSKRGMLWGSSIFYDGHT